MISISLRDTEIPGPLKELSVDQAFNENEAASEEEKVAILNGKFKELIESWKVLVAGKTEFQRAYAEG